MSIDQGWVTQPQHCNMYVYGLYVSDPTWAGETGRIVMGLI